MSDRQQLAEHGTNFCLAAMGLASGGLAAVAIPVAILTTIGMEKWASCDAVTFQRAKAAAEDALRSDGVSEDDMSVASALLKENRHKITFDPAAMADAVRKGDLPERLVQAIFGQGGLKGHTDGTKAAITTTLTAAFNIFRGTKAYQAAFTQEMVMALLASKKGEIEIISETRDNTRLILDHLRQTDEFRRMRDAGVTEPALVELASRIAADVPDAATAFRELKNAVEIAIRVQAEGRVASNHGDFVDTVLRRVAELARDGRYDAASADIDAALAQEQAESAARTIRLLDAGIEQDTLRRNAPAVADRLLRKAQVENRAGFDDLRAVFMEWYERGRDKGLNFDLAVSIALADLTHSHATTPDQRGNALNDLGTALQSLGERESGTARLEQAVAAYRAALEQWTRDRVPLDWAGTQMNLGTALQSLGERESGTARLEQAVAAHRAALEERTRDRVPLDWAGTQMNLGNALQTLGQRESGTARLEQAVAAYRAALEEWTRDRVPLDWAMTQMNLGNALQTLGQRE
ncbi:MAG: tetratricopeptide repeat protein, partial [Rhodobacterales bacterium]|nr:tetratricopeptide repeat protein [Rhodobacterales bacterium]